MPDPPAMTVVPTACAVDRDIPIIIEPEAEAEERGRLKRRRQTSHSPARAPSPSRGHDRNSGSRYREHHRKHHRPSSPSSSISPPTPAQKKTRRRSDAEPDHTFRGRARNRSGSRGRTRSPIFEDEDACVEEGQRKRFRKRSTPPSRPRNDVAQVGGEVRRQRSYPNLYKAERRDSKGDNREQPSDKTTFNGATEEDGV
ncbi:Nn.00g023200.m01.CDS01 [Neocucurbitaria sp. VM-36]